MPTALIALAVFLAGSISLGAKNTNPGDTLYPVKVGINEKISGAFKISAENEARWQALLAERRLSEAEILAIADNLTPAILLELESRFDAHVRAYEVVIAELNQNENYEKIVDVSAQFESTLKAHVGILAQISAEVDSETKAELDRIITKIQTQIDQVSNTRVEAEVKVDSETQADNSGLETSLQVKIEATENKIENILTLLDKKADNLSAETKAYLEAQVETKKENLADIKAEIENKNYTDARDQIRELTADLNDIQATITTSAILKLEAWRNNGPKMNEDKNENKIRGKAELESKGNVDKDNDGPNVKQEQKLETDIKVDLGL